MLTIRLRLKEPFVQFSFWWPKTKQWNASGESVPLLRQEKHTGHRQQERRGIISVNPYRWHS
jgi:hypothetical protein